MVYRPKVRPLNLLSGIHNGKIAFNFDSGRQSFSLKDSQHHHICIYGKNESFVGIGSTQAEQKNEKKKKVRMFGGEKTFTVNPYRRIVCKHNQYKTLI